MGLKVIKEDLIVCKSYRDWDGVEQDEPFEPQAILLRDKVTSYAANMVQTILGSISIQSQDQNPLDGYDPDSLAKIRVASNLQGESAIE